MSAVPAARQRAAACRAFTVVELLIATALSAMLVVSIMGLLGTMKLQCRQLVKRTPVRPWQPLLADRIRRDLANARRLTVMRDQFVLVGYMGTRGRDHFSTLRAAEVTYRVARTANISCLLRDERPLDAMTNSLGTRQLLATGISGFRFVPRRQASSNGEYSGVVPEWCQIEFFDESSTNPVAEIWWCK